MNCHRIRHHLLSSEKPDAPSENARRHLRGCAACRRWHVQLVRLENSLREIPTPQSEMRTRTMRQFLAESPAAASGTGRQLPWLVRLSPATVWNWWHRHDAHWRALASGGLAAALLFVTLVILLWGPDDRSVTPVAKKKATDPFLARLFDRDVHLASARTPRARLEILTELANDLQIQTRAAVSGAADDDIVQLTDLYEQVLNEGVVAGARKLPAELRRQVLTPISERLAMIGVETEQMALNLPHSTAGALQRIAAASRQADGQLRAFVAEVSS